MIHGKFSTSFVVYWKVTVCRGMSQWDGKMKRSQKPVGVVPNDATKEGADGRKEKWLDDSKRLRDAREASGISVSQFAKRIGVDTSYVSAAESGTRSVSDRLKRRYSSALGLPDDFFLSALSTSGYGHAVPESALVSQLIQRLVDTAMLHPAKARRSSDRNALGLPRAAVDIAEGELASYLRKLLDAEQKSPSPEIWLLWTARWYDRDNSIVRKYLYGDGIAEFTAEGGKVVHILRRSDDPKWAGAGVRLLIEVRKQFALRSEQYECALDRYLVASDRPHDLYVSGSNGFILGFAGATGGEPGQGVYVPNGANTLLKDYMRSMEYYAKDLVQFYALDRLHEFHRDFLLPLARASEILVIRRYWPDFTRPIEHFRSDSDWWQRTLRNKSAEAARDFSLEQHSKERADACRYFHDCLTHREKGKVQFILCDDSVEEWVRTGKRRDQLDDVALESRPERIARLVQIITLLETHGSKFELALVSEKTFLELPGVKRSNQNRSVCWSVVGPTVLIEVVEPTAELRQQRLYRTLIDDPNVREEFRGAFDKAWHSLNPEKTKKGRAAIDRLRQLLGEARGSQ